MVRTYKTLKALRKGDVVEVEGFRVKAIPNREIQVGDLYVAERNGTPRLLLAKEVVPVPPPGSGLQGGWVNPVENAYNYDIGECVVVEEA